MVLLACSGCGDMIFRAQHWWAQAFPLIILALLLDAVALAIVGRVRQRRAKRSRALVVVPSLAIPVLGTFIGFGTTVGVWVTLAVALAATAVSLQANREDGAVVTGARAAFVLGAVVLAFVMQRPERRDTDELVRVASYVTRFQIRDGWIFDELRRREDAAASVTALLKEEDPYRLVERVRLHANLGLPASERAEACERLRGANKGGLAEKACAAR